MVTNVSPIFTSICLLLMKSSWILTALFMGVLGYISFGFIKSISITTESTTLPYASYNSWPLVTRSAVVYWWLPPQLVFSRKSLNLLARVLPPQASSGHQSLVVHQHSGHISLGQQNNLFQGEERPLLAAPLSSNKNHWTWANILAPSQTFYLPYCLHLSSLTSLCCKCHCWFQ